MVRKKNNKARGGRRRVANNSIQAPWRTITVRGGPVPRMEAIPVRRIIQHKVIPVPMQKKPGYREFTVDGASCIKQAGFGNLIYVHKVIVWTLGTSGGECHDLYLYPNPPETDTEASNISWRALSTSKTESTALGYVTTKPMEGPFNPTRILFRAITNAPETIIELHLTVC